MQSFWYRPVRLLINAHPSVRYQHCNVCFAFALTGNHHRKA
jgi:hypothetical protein